MLGTSVTKALSDSIYAILNKAPFRKTSPEYAGMPIARLQKMAKQDKNLWMDLPNGTAMRYLSPGEALVRHKDGSIYQLSYTHPQLIRSRLICPTVEELMNRTVSNR